ncbi:hypothetical protein N9L47_01805 [Rhodobacteraceae bacterium]|nr:hypothetical protein [Paracoccaceae bacterium]
MNFDQLKRSKTHLALADAWNLEDGYCDRSTALAEAIAAKAADPHLAIILLAAESLDSLVLHAGGDKCCTICRTDVMRAIYMDSADAELVLRIAGFEKDDSIWRSGDPRFKRQKLQFSKESVKQTFDFCL